MISIEKAIFRNGQDGQYRGKDLLPRIVTTSWDDGDVCDFRLAEMLSVHKLPATFYVPITGHHGSRALGHRELRDLDGEGFEIGGHGFSHVILPQCTKEVLAMEVEASKQRLEDILGSEVRMFAYPRGRYSSLAIQLIKRAGYAGARTTEMLAHRFNYDPYKMPTTIHVFQHSRSAYLRNAARVVDLGKAWRYLRQLRQLENWVELAKILFDSVLEAGGIFHLWGHSWEIEELGLWNDLEEILTYVSNRKDVLYLSNSSVLEYGTTKTCFEIEIPCASQQG